jgi:uncharacterized protein (TIGR02145 family)
MLFMENSTTGMRWAMDVDSARRAGVPLDAEFSTLENYLGGGSVAVSGLWLNPNTGATNESGFSGLPGSSRKGFGGSFGDPIGFYGNWWSSSESNSTNSKLLRLSWNSSVADRNYYSTDKANGYSVRCLKD